MNEAPARILIVDDEPYMLRVEELSLKKGGFELLKACNGRQALEIARNAHPDLIVMDVLMPDLDGLSALDQLKLDPATSPIPVIMISARGHLMTRQEAEDRGAALFLTKPFSPTHLLQEVQRLFEHHPLPCEPAA